MVFQHYTGRQLRLIEGNREVIPEVSYGTKRLPVDSCDWFLDLPSVLVLIECKARQPIESLRTGGAAWLDSVEGSINRGIKQLNRSHQDIDKIAAACADIDPTKPRVGLVVTLEPFYLNQNWLLWDHLRGSDFPVGVVSIGELESLVLHSADDLGTALLNAAASARDNVMTLNDAFGGLEGRVNPLLDETWESIDFFHRVESLAETLHSDQGEEAGAGSVQV